MLAHLRGRSGWRHALAVVALLALAVKLLVPTGFMPGTSLAQPIMLCPGQGAMPMAMDHGGHDDPAKAPQGGVDHPCAFAGLGAPPLVPDLPKPITIPGVDRAEALAAPGRSTAPGRGMAAPPPPSHAPPALRA